MKEPKVIATQGAPVVGWVTAKIEGRSFELAIAIINFPYEYIKPKAVA